MGIFDIFRFKAKSKGTVSTVPTKRKIPGNTSKQFENSSNTTTEIKDLVVQQQTSIDKIFNVLENLSKRQDHLLGHIETQNINISKLQQEIRERDKEIAELTLKNVTVSTDGNNSKHLETDKRSVQTIPTLQTARERVKRATENLKEMLVLLEKKPMSYAQIAKALKITEGGARGLIHEARILEISLTKKTEKRKAYFQHKNGGVIKSESKQ